MIYTHIYIYKYNYSSIKKIDNSDLVNIIIRYKIEIN